MSASSFPAFNAFEPTQFKETLYALLDANLERINQLLSQPSYTWENLMEPMEAMDDAIERHWSPMSHLHSVVNTKELRDCYQACLPKLSAYESAIGQNEVLYKAIKSISLSSLNATQQKIIADTLRDFELSGVALSDEKKQRFEAIQTKLSSLGNQFENHVLDATDAFSLHITDESRLEGLPAHTIESAQELAKEKSLAGWLLTLEIPCYIAVVTHANDRALRETFYNAYVTRASDEGPFAGQFDNSDIMNELLALRHEKANLLGFSNYAELSLATKMAKSTDEVLTFLLDLANRGYAQAQADMSSLENFGIDEYQLDSVKPWDIAFLSEKLRQKNYQLSEEELRPYFPQDKVMEGLFAIIEKLYGIRFNLMKEVDTWHSDVMCYGLIDEEGQDRGYVYIDLYARPQKRGGAWMDALQGRRRLPNGLMQLPIATLTCNFTKPTLNKKATFSHDEVVTLFHEFGHCLHHLLTKVDYLGASGINGVEWDAVELPSQFFENWCYEKAALQLLTSHLDTEEPLPNALYEKMMAAKNFQSAMAMMRQLEFSIFDFRIHQEYDEKEPNFVADILNQVRQETTVVPIVPYNRFQHSFTHIFAGGYAAGYYSYKWAEVLSSDAYSRFEDGGVFNQSTGRDFLHCILEVGGSKKALDAFVAFRGRAPKVDALLRHNGIKPSSLILP